MEFTAITSRQNTTLKHFARLAREKKYRLRTGKMLCEGEKMLGEALDSDIRIESIVICAEQSLTASAQQLIVRAYEQGAALFTASTSLFHLISDVETPSPLVFSCTRPVQQQIDFTAIDRAILLDGIQDPGNLGTILRTADAFGLDLVVLCEGCTDPTAPKVIRSTMGAAFRQPICQMPLKQAVEQLHAQSIPVYAAVLDADSQSVYHMSARAAVIIGNEGHGVSQQAIELCDGKRILPMTGRAESLNAGVAAAIFMWEMCRKEG